MWAPALGLVTQPIEQSFSHELQRDSRQNAWSFLSWDPEGSKIIPQVMESVDCHACDLHRSRGLDPPSVMHP